MNQDPSSNRHIPAVAYLSTQSDSDEIDLLELWQAIWQRKWLIIATTFFSVAIAVVVAIFLPNIYTSTATLAPSEEQRGGGLSALASQFGGLASLAGVNLSGGGADKTAVAVEIAGSRQFMTRFVREHKLEVPLMAVKGMDKTTNELVIDADIYDKADQRWIRKVANGKSVEPTNWELYKEISKIISVVQDKKSGFVTVTVDYYSPSIAKQWVDWFVADLNNYMKNRDQIDAKRNIEYLKKQLEKTAVADMQSVFYQLIEQQTKTLMLSEVNPEYVFKTLDPAVVAEEKTKPKRALIVILGGILGGMFGVIIALIKYAANRRNKSVAV
ncbi:MAG: Wzz/FepE/Etk N-terminal domain-containing protein [Tolumonas sp.]|nr:Wzz/FepE/Etk N-terminal domain-containing protein [Tolumonas sp.]